MGGGFCRQRGAGGKRKGGLEFDRNPWGLEGGEGEKNEGAWKKKENTATRDKPTTCPFEIRGRGGKRPIGRTAAVHQKRSAGEKRGRGGEEGREKRNFVGGTGIATT